MALRKPSEYFKKKEEVVSVEKSIGNIHQDIDPNTFSDAFESFKSNLNKIEVLSEFSNTLSDYSISVEKINILSETIKDIESEIQNLLTKEDLDRALVSQLLLVEQSVRDVQSKVKSINENNLKEIRSDVSELTKSVNEFFQVDVPKYKKLIVDSEVRISNRYEELKENVNETLSGIEEFVDNKYQHLTENLQAINKENLSGILSDFEILKEEISKFKETDIPKYKNFIVETEIKTETKLNEFQEKLDDTVSDILEKINLVEGDKIDLVNAVNQKIKDVKTLSEKVTEHIKSNQIINEEHKEELNKKLAELEVEVVRNESHLKKQDGYIEEIQEKLNQKVSNLKSEIVRNETYVKKQTGYIEDIQEEVREVISKLQIEKLEEKNYELIKKVNYLEEIFEKFNQKTLTEGLLNEPPEVKNNDKLTPLNQNFVTLDQLQEHYRLFINRIQQQLATLGGGGETRLKYLDDIVGIATNPSAYDGKFLKYDHSIGKFEFVTVSDGGGTGESFWSQSGVGIVTTSNVGINTNNPTSTLTVNGDALIVGVVTATDFNSASDIKLKENVSVINNPLDKIVKLEGVNFQWKENGKKSLGVIAQEVEKVLPELVFGEDTKTVNYNGIVGLLIECVKQQQKEIEDLKKIINK